ncbi:MAG: DNA polymerase III subunit delta' [Nitrospiraceae bacterium]
MPFSDIIGHERPKAILQTTLRHDRVAHAYLFHGDDGIGKKLLALRFAQAINCESGDGLDACGACRSCRQIETRTHPDFLVIEPDRELANPQIKIEQIRELEHQIVYQPLVALKKIFLLDDADRMTLGAANALLKTLEEPPAHSVLLLVSSRPSALPATVRSRCQSLRFAPPARTQVEAALIRTREIPPADARLLAAASQSRLGAALTMDPAETRTKQDELSALVSPQTLRSVAAILTAAEALHKSDRGPEVLDWLAQWIRDLLLVCVGADPDHLIHADRLPALKTAARSARTDRLAGLLDEIDALQRSAGRNLNLQMALETVLLRLREATLSAG